jgi:hypothetical protein
VKIKWRLQQLSNVLANDVPDVKKIILKDQLLFPEYTGQKPEGPIADCIASDSSVWSGTTFVMPKNLKWQPCTYGSDTANIKWSSTYFKDALYIIVSQKESSDPASAISPFTGIEVRIEPQRLYPAIHFVFDHATTNNDGDPVHIIGYPLIYKEGFREINDKGIWYSAVRIPFQILGINEEQMHPLRMDVKTETRDGVSCSWRPYNPKTERLILESDNPADLGWLIFNR